MSAHFRFSPDILRRLGEELVPHADQGLLELTKNAFDADAVNCSIKLENVHIPGGKILVTDDGVGMNESAIESSWLVLGLSSKAKQPTKKFSRIPAGNKGLGRLAALRLGHKAILRTRPEDEPGKEYVASLDWDLFDQAQTVESIDISIQTKKTDLPHGTTIEIQDVRNTLAAWDVQRLAQSLILMSDPFSGREGFRANLESPEFLELETKVRNSYFDDAVYRLQADLNNDGRAEFRAYDWKGIELWYDRTDTSYKTVPAVFELWIFILNKETFSSRPSTVKEVSEWLKVTGGVHIYEDGLRVAPYGGADADWLEMNVERAKSPEERPSTNTSIGIVRITDNDGRLVQKTDRNGYIENEAFAELQRFGKDALKWLFDKRIKIAEERRARKRAESAKHSKQASASLEKVLQHTLKSPEKRKEIEREIKKVLSASDREKSALREDLQLYRSLATAGMTSAMLSHEISHPIGQIDKLIRKISRSLPKAILDDLEWSISTINAAKSKLMTYARLPLKLLRIEKRRSGAQNLNQIVEQTVKDYAPILDDEKIRVELDFGPNAPKVFGSVALLEGVLVNLISNTIKAFARAGTPPEKRSILINTSIEDDNAFLSFSDSGPGIVDMPLEDIWLPGKTSEANEAGTGFGLTIVRDSVADLGGSITAEANCEIGGARFVLKVPVIDR